MADFDPYSQWLGIDSAEHPIDHYRLLGLERFESDAQKISAAADDRMRHIRSFQTGPRGLFTQKLLNELAAAKLRLLNARSKEEYDRSLREGPAPESDISTSDDDIVLPQPIEMPTVDPMAAAPVAHPIAAHPIAAQPIVAHPTVAQPIAYPHPAPVIQPALEIAPKIKPAASDITITPIISVSTPRRQTRPAKAGTAWYIFAYMIGAVATAALVWGVGKMMRKSTSQRKDAPTATSQSTATDDDSQPASSSTSMVQQALGRVYLTAETAIIHGDSPQKITQNNEYLITDWTSESDFLSWRFRLRKGGGFRLKITYAVHPDASAGRIAIEIDGQKKSSDLRSSGGPETFITDEMIVNAKEPGEHTLELRAISKPGAQVMIFKSIELEPYRP